jgi:hypothetical protein
MTDYAISIALLFTGIILGVLLGLMITIDGLVNYKKEAFDRGFMAQCVGKTGYYWECE